MSDMLDTVAKAIYEGRNGTGAYAWSRRDAARKAPYLKDARVAIEVVRPLLQRVLDKMERDWSQIDAEFGPTKGGLEAEIAAGREAEIAELRALLAGNGDNGAAT